MKRNQLIFALLAIMAIFITSCTKTTNLLIGKTKYIVFSNAYFGGESTNNAILIADDVEIKNLEKLYDNDLEYLYKSGFDYQIHFFDKDNNHLHTRTINSETDEYSKNNKEIKTVINSLVNIIKQNPTHYIYNLKVDKSLRSDSVIGLLKKDGFSSFLLSDQIEQYPQLKLTYCEPYSDKRNLNDTEKKFINIVQDINFEIQPIDSSYIHRSTKNETKYVDFKTNKISRLYYFSTKTNIDSITKRIYDMKIKYLFAESRSQHYFIQLLSKENLEEIKSKFKNHIFIEDISEANNGFVYQECNLID